MNERGLKILNLLIRRPEYRISDLEEKLHLTKRQINYSIARLNDTFDEMNLPKIQRSNSGNFSIPLEIIQSLAIYDTIDFNTNDFLADSERTEILLLYVMIHSEIISLYHIIDLLSISKNTALADIKNANEYAKRYEVEIVFSRSKGYEMNGEELQIRKLMNDIILKKMKLSKTFYPLQAYLPVGKDQVIHLIRSVENIIGVSYADEHFDYMIEIISYTVARIKSGKALNQHFFMNQVVNTLEYKTLKRLLPNYWINIDDDIEWFALFFLSSNTYSNQLNDKTTDQQLRILIREMVNQFQKQTFLVIEDQENFEKRLFDHLRPACFRIKYGVKLGNLGLENLILEKNHSILINLMKELIQPLETEFGILFPPDELELLSFYFGYQLDQTDMSITPKKRAVVVCSNGLIVSKMMIESLRNLFPEIHFLTSLSVREFKEFASDYNLVFTSTPLNTNLPQYIIKPLMSDKEQISLRYRVLKESGILELDHMINEILELVIKNTTITNYESLESDLKQLLASYKGNRPSGLKEMPALDYYIKLKYIQIIDQPMDWQEAIALASKPLLEDGVIMENYVNTLVEQTKDVCDYCFFGTQMAIPHAGIDEGVVKDGIAILICKQPINYPHDKKIHIIAPIAIFDLSKHLRAINQLESIGSNSELLNQLIQAESVDDIYKRIEELR